MRVSDAIPMNTAEHVITASITILNILLHLLGCYMLYNIYNWTAISSQQMIILHISVCEIFGSCALLVAYLCQFYGYDDESPLSVYSYCFHIAFDRILCLLMIALTSDRLMAVVLGFKYPLYWRVTKTKKLLICVWIAGVVFLITSVLLY